MKLPNAESVSGWANLLRVSYESLLKSLNANAPSIVPMHTMYFWLINREVVNVPLLSSPDEPVPDIETARMFLKLVSQQKEASETDNSTTLLF